MDYLAHNIAINLKKIRKAKGMSLDMVSEQTGVSKGMLATIEKGNANPSIGVLGKIMSGLRIDLADLTCPPEADAYLVDIEGISPTKHVEGQYTVWTCFPIQDNRVVEIYRIDIEPGGEYKSGSHGEHTKEYLSIIQGSLVLILGDKKYEIKDNQSFRFTSDQDHSYKNETTQKISFMSFFVAI